MPVIDFETQEMVGVFDKQEGVMITVGPDPFARRRVEVYLHDRGSKRCESISLSVPQATMIADAIIRLYGRPTTAAVPEPPPSGGMQCVVDELLDDIARRGGDYKTLLGDFLARDRMGLEKYGTRLMTRDGRNSLMDAYQEALDQAVYLKKCLLEKESGQEEAHPARIG